MGFAGGIEPTTEEGVNMARAKVGIAGNAVTKIALSLTPAERKLLCSGIIPEVGCIQQIAAAASNTVELTPSELEDLAGWVAAEANHTKSRKLEAALDRIYQKIETAKLFAAARRIEPEGT
jgi:hypothetical protein